MKLSIIIPLFNSEKFIIKCIESLLDQNISSFNYEIIVINDGSTDHSEQIVQEFCLTNKNIVLINQDNQGNGAARNKGIEIANGDYIYFIDSDDYLATNVLPELLLFLDTHNLDIIGFDSQVTMSSDLNHSNYKIKHKILNPISGIEFIKQYNYKAEVWWYIVRKSFYISCDIRFYERKFVQDSYITTTLLLKAKKILYLPIDAHRYRKHDNSITKNKSRVHISNHIKDMFFAIEKLSDLSDGISDKDCLKRLKCRQESYLFFLLMRFPKSNVTFKELKKYMNKAKKMNIYPMKHFIGEDYHGFKYKILTAILNNKYLMIILLYLLKLKYKNI